MSKHEIVTASAFVITKESLGEYTPNGSYADISDMAGKTVLELMRALAWTLRQRNDLLTERKELTVSMGAAQHARVQAERKLVDAKAAFKASLALVNEEEATPEEVTPVPAYVFTASNGIALSCSLNGGIGGPNPGVDGWAVAMLELFDTDRVAQAYTWRWPEDPHLVVIRNETLRDGKSKRWVHAYDERTIAEGHSWYCADTSKVDPERNEDMHLAAHAYFQAVPLI